MDGRDEARSPTGTAEARVTAPAGTFAGTSEDGYALFRGIRYAQPPVGTLRFAPPAAAASATESDARAFGPISIQDIDPLPWALPGAEHNFYAPQSVAAEDCLNLNIWSPDLAGRAPVLVWIHGGAFLYGSGTGRWIDGARHARENGLLVVTINYRLGYLGGLFLGDHDPRRSNLALQDQIQALRWVRENIAAFGGDPERVTVGGQSAGAMSAAALVVAPDARGLFRRAVIESGHLATFVAVETARATTAAILGRLGVDTTGDVLGQLREVSTFRILALQRHLGLSRRTFPLVADDVVLPSDPLRVLAERTGIDILIGTTSEEDRLFAVTGWTPPKRNLPDTLARYLPHAETRAEGVRLYEAVRTEAGASDEDLAHLVATDHGWTEPARRFAETHAAGGGRTYLYEFGWGSTILDGRLGAAHLVDLPFFFDNLDAPGVPDLLGPEAASEPARRLASGLGKALATFAELGVPSGPLGDWPAFTPSRRATLVLNAEFHVAIDRLSERLDFWAKHRTASAQPLSTLAAVE